MSKLSESDAKLFHKIMDTLLFYTNKNLNIEKNCQTKETFFKINLEKTVSIRKKLFSDPTIIDSFIKENPENFSADELNIASSWKKSKEGDFFLVKYDKESALFLNPNEHKVYALLGITNSFYEMFEGYSPIMVKLRMLPFKGKLTYEGILFPYSLTFGGGMRSSLKTETAEAIQKYGTISSFEQPIVEMKKTDEEMLRFYFQSQDTRDRFYEEIEKLRKKSPELEAVYHQEKSAIIARNIKKSLKSNGIKGHFAVLVNSVVASGLKEAELDANIQKLVPKNKQSWIYRFKLT